MYPPVNGSGDQPRRRRGNITLRQIAASDTIYTFSDDNTDELWLPFRNGFVIRKTGSDSSVAPQFTFYDGTGNITRQELSGQWTLPSLPTDSAIPADVPPVPVLVSTDDRLIAAFDPESGKLAVGEELSIAVRHVRAGSGDTIAHLLGQRVRMVQRLRRIRAARYTTQGRPGRITARRRRPVVRDALAARLRWCRFPGADGLPAGQSPESDIGRCVSRPTGQYPGAPVIAGGKVYAGGGLKFR